MIIIISSIQSSESRLSIDEDTSNCTVCFARVNSSQKAVFASSRTIFLRQPNEISVARALSWICNECKHATPTHLPTNQ
ncbi:hypothetical protein TCAL_15775 [Tigriopus californicus]|uniref:Uncharacterized protein n=1 Tax=Tigriopus californicus TaxID=6832 RepID=A0A553P6B0_TIGCA|nr:hypothetical protein TCAL_15775 [Tigriopus californicus]